MATLGRQVLVASTGDVFYQVQASNDTEWAPIGVTIDWATVTAVGSDTTLASGLVVKSGLKVIPAGTVLGKITSGGKYGPVDTTASDGRQTATNGAIGVVNQDILELNPAGFGGAVASDFTGLIVGGHVWQARVLAGGTNQVTLANLKTALPRLTWVV
jgi:hypothetical protein